MTDEEIWAELERRGLLVARSTMDGAGSIELQWPEGTPVEVLPDGVVAQKVYLSREDDGWVAVAFTPHSTHTNALIDHVCVADSFDEVHEEVLRLIGKPIPSALDS